MKISYSLRAFAIYFVILGSLIWFTLDNAIERLNDGMRQSAESVMVDMANILASHLELNLLTSSNNNELNTTALEQIFTAANKREINAQIYQVTKKIVDSQIYITNKDGIVLYDSTNRHTGENFSRWRDVRFTLDGLYGARTSYIHADRTEPEDPKAMVVGAPIYHADKIIGSVSVLKPINALEGHLLTETKQLQRYAFALLLMALVLGYLLSLWFTHSLNKIANYANDMAAGKKVEVPTLRDSRLTDLTNSISNMRTQIDGKEYVENYIHSLTHELKTPITSIHGAVELMSEEMPAKDRKLFLDNINTSNNRMSRLVDRMLSLAKLESLNNLVATSEFDIVPTIKRLFQERGPTINSRNIKINYPQQPSFNSFGDKILISQATANLIDNAINFCSEPGQIDISLQNIKINEMTYYQISIFNQGNAVPDFALPKLFDRFFSLPPTDQNKQASKSTG